MSLVRFVVCALVVAGCAEPPEPVAEAPGPPVSPAPVEEHGELLAEIEALHRDRRYEEGLARVGEALEQHPGEALLHFQQGLLLQATGDFATAEAALNRAITLRPAHYPSYRALGDLALGRGAPAEAAEHFEKCVAGLPEHAGCRYGLGLSLIDLGELDAAAVPLASAAGQLDRADVWAELGQLERRRRRMDEALAAYDKALDLDSSHLPSLVGMGQTLVAAGRGEEGRAMLERHREQAALEDELDALRRAAAQPDSDIEIQLQIARIHRQRGQGETEEAVLRQVLARAPGFPPAVLALANRLAHRGDPDAADQLVDSLPQEMSGNPAVLFLKGTIDIARGDEAAALAHFEASLARGEWPPSIYLDAGRAWSRAGFPKHAVAAFERAVVGMPDSVEARAGLARSRQELADQLSVSNRR